MTGCCGEADAILRELAAAEEPTDSNGSCVFCGSSNYAGGHYDGCVWRRARMLVFAHDHSCSSEGPPGG